MKIRINGMTMNYVERGTPGGIPIVFVHGFPFNLETWEPQMRTLPNHFRAIAYDIRGHGQSDVGDGQYSIEFFVDDLIALLDHLVIEKTILCGLSMGGYIALRAFERHAGRFNGLVLCDTKSEPDGDEGKVKRAASLKAVKTNGVDQFAEGFAKAVFADSTFRDNPSLVEKVKSIIKANSPIGIGGTLLALASRTDTTPVLAKLAVPTLILCGEHDALTTPKDAEFMHARIKGSSLHIIPNAAHLSNLENPTVFNEQLISFLKVNR
jgi:pimeloyl-ACP methyl ester carboxylesterase